MINYPTSLTQRVVIWACIWNSCILLYLRILYSRPLVIKARVIKFWLLGTYPDRLSISKTQQLVFFCPWIILHIIETAVGSNFASCYIFYLQICRHPFKGPHFNLYGILPLLSRSLQMSSKIPSEKSCPRPRPKSTRTRGQVWDHQFIWLTFLFILCFVRPSESPGLVPRPWPKLRKTSNMTWVCYRILSNSSSECRQFPSYRYPGRGNAISSWRRSSQFWWDGISD
jgi:hypothetical protein